MLSYLLIPTTDKVTVLVQQFYVNEHFFACIRLYFASCMPFSIRIQNNSLKYIQLYFSQFIKNVQRYKYVYFGVP